MKNQNQDQQINSVWGSDVCSADSTLLLELLNDSFNTYANDDQQFVVVRVWGEEHENVYVAFVALNGRFFVAKNCQSVLGWHFVVEYNSYEEMLLGFSAWKFFDTENALIVEAKAETNDEDDDDDDIVDSVEYIDEYSNYDFIVANHAR